MLTFTNSDAKGIVEKNLGSEATKQLGDLDFLPFPKYVLVFPNLDLVPDMLTVGRPDLRLQSKKTSTTSNKPSLFLMMLL